jgi:parallel beta-helix repeat protein
MARVLLLLVVGVILAATGGPTAQATGGTLWVTSDTTLATDYYGSVVISADHVTFDCAGHTIYGPGEYLEPGNSSGISVDWTVTEGGITIRNCTVRGFETFGIVGSGTDTVGDVITNNRVFNNGAGITVGADHSTISNNIVHDNTWSGIGAANRDQTITGNVSYGNGLDGFNLCTLMDSRVSANRAQGNGGSGFDFCYHADGDTITNNIAVQNGQDGFVDGWGTIGNVLRDNAASQNIGHGFAVQGLSGTLSGNVATSNGDAGFELMGQGTVLTHNIANVNSEEGFMLSAGSSANMLTQNVANHNSGFGFLIADGATGNVVERCVGHANAPYDAQDENASGNLWLRNNFGTTNGIN